MHHRIFRGLATLLIVIVMATTASAKQLVKEFRGTGNTTTAAFQVEGPWILDWRLDGDYDTRFRIAADAVDLLLGKPSGRPPRPGEG